jgi:hypothetical protein
MVIDGVRHRGHASRPGESIMMLEGRKTLVWGTIAAAVVSALWLSATDSSLMRLGGGSTAEPARVDPPRLLKRSVPSPGASSQVH